MRGTIEGMGARAESNANDHMAQVQKEYDDAKEAIDNDPGCAWW